MFLKGSAEAGKFGGKKLEAILRAVIDCLTTGGGAAVDYARLCNPETIEDVEVIKGPTLLALAVFVGKTRLIDNCVLEVPA